MTEESVLLPCLLMTALIAAVAALLCWSACELIQNLPDTAWPNRPPT